LPAKQQSWKNWRTRQPDSLSRIPTLVSALIPASTSDDVGKP
jgi:hypothetical protein